MNELSTEQKDNIVKVLLKRGANNPCPRCNNKQFTLVGGYFNHPIQFGLKGIAIGGPSIPSVVAVCTKCGFLSQHALGIIGLLQEGEKQQEEKNG